MRRRFKGAAWWLNPYSTETQPTFFYYFGLVFQDYFSNMCKMSTFWTLLWIEQLEEERQECVSVLSCLLKDTCWVAWLISSSFSRLSGLCGADYQEELIPVALLISLIRARGRWLEGSCTSQGRSGTVVCTGMTVVIHTTGKLWKLVGFKLWLENCAQRWLSVNCFGVRDILPGYFWWTRGTLRNLNEGICNLHTKKKKKVKWKRQILTITVRAVKKYNE